MLDLDYDEIDYDVNVRNHCHITGKQRGSAHKNCNTSENVFM